MKSIHPLFSLLLAISTLSAASSIPEYGAEMAVPPQDQGLPYTRSAQGVALEKIKGTIALFAGSRYAYADGLRVRLDQQDLRHGEARMIEGDLYVPVGFTAVLDLADPLAAADKAPDYLKDRWVYTLQLPQANPSASTKDIDGKAYVNLTATAKEKGLKVSTDPRGLVLIGKADLAFSGSEKSLLDSVITLFDTPDRFADPAIAPTIVPTLKKQGVWTDHVKVSEKDLALLNGPETKWPTAPESSFDTNGFNEPLLGSKVPSPGVYPRLLFSPEDLPMMQKRSQENVLARKALIQMEELFKKSWWDPSTSDGQIFQKLYSGETNGLEWDFGTNLPISSIPQQFKGQKTGIYSSHIAYVPECLTAMALYSLLTGDEAHGKQVANAFVNYYKLREPLIDQWNAMSDSEFGAAPYNGGGAVTCWRGMHGLVGQMNLGLGFDFAGKWMTPEQVEDMRRIIVKATYGRRPYGQDSTVRFRDVNWVAWDLPHYLALAAIEGLPGADPEGLESDRETVRAFCDWGVDESGVVYESNGKTPGSLQFQTLSMITLARRGENLFAHPHWRKFLQAQIQMTSPTGKVTVNSGTQYSPFSRQELSMMFINEQKAFFPEERYADYLLSQSSVKTYPEDDYYRTWLPDTNAFDPEAYRRSVASMKRLRLPSITYPGFVSGVLYNTDFKPTTREDLGLPLDFSDPVHGVYSSYSDRSTNAAWINLIVRPDHYYGAGHHHADAGMFHFSGAGVDWFTQSPFHQVFDGRYFNLVQVDGHSEAEPSPQGGTAYNAAATYLGMQQGEQGASASADLTYAYSWRWMTQPPGSWPEAVQALGWTPDPTPRIQEIFAGTARNKMRPWWLTYNSSNYIATSRAPFNPMEFVFRTAGLVRGPHAYGFVIDDLRKDGKDHLYQWVAMLNGGVWEAVLPDSPKGTLVLGYNAKEDATVPVAHAKPLAPSVGDPLLLVYPLSVGNTSGATDGSFRPIAVETAQGPADKKGVAQQYNRMLINSVAKEGRFKVLLIPFRMGEEIPGISYDPSSKTASVSWKDQKDSLSFKTDEKGKTSIVVTRDGKSVVDSEK
ncbi:MAG: hypothetical protein WCP60_08120 [bacterium]